MSSQTLENQGQDAGAKQPLVTVSDAGGNQELYVPTTTTSSSNSSHLPETIDGTGVLTQATAVSAGVSDPSSSANYNSHNHLQQIQVRVCVFDTVYMRVRILCFKNPSDKNLLVCTATMTGDE